LILREEMEIHDLPVQFISETLSLPYNLKLSGYLVLLYLNTFESIFCFSRLSTCPLVRFTRLARKVHACILWTLVAVIKDIPVSGL